MPVTLVSKIKTLFSKSVAPWVGVGAGLAAWGAVLIGWMNVYSPMEIRRQLIPLCPIFLWIGVACLAYALCLNFAPLWKIIRESGTRRQWLTAAVICLLAFLLVHDVAPRTHRLFYDEDIYEAIALNMAKNNQAAMSNDGRWDYGHFQGKILEFNKQPNAWPFVMSLAYRIFGISEKVGFNLSNVLFAVAVMCVFLVGGWLFESPWAGLFAAYMYACIPNNVRWFSSMDGDPPTACFTVLAVLLTLFFFRSRTKAALFLCVSAWVFAAQFRFEVLLLGLLVFAMFYVEGWDELKTPRVYAFLLLFFVLLSAHLLQLYAVRDESWGARGNKLSLDYFFQNLKTNTVYYFNRKEFPLPFSLLAVAGLGWPGQWKVKLYTALWFLLSWAIFLFFYAGGYQFGVDVRFSIMSMAPLALLAGRGADRLVSAGRRWFRAAYVPLAMGMVLIAELLFYLPSMRAVGRETWQCRDDHRAAEYFASLVPDDGIVMTHNPNMFQIFGKNAAQMSLFTEHSDYALHVIKPQFQDKIYLHWNYWCNTQDPVQVRFCTNMIDSYETQLVAERVVGGARYALYRVLGDRIR